MRRYALRRLAFLPLILLVVSIGVFGLLRWLPGQDPADVIAGQGATEAQKERIRDELGLERPIVVQYLDWVGGILRGDFGRTFRGEAPIAEEFRNKFPMSFQLIMMSLVVSTIAGVGFGVLSAVFRNRLPDYGVRVFAVLGASIPEFFLLIMLIIVLPWMVFGYARPLGGYVPFYEDPLRNLQLLGPPAIVIGLAGAAPLMRLVRTTMLEVLRSDYVRTARSKGLRERTVIFNHGVRSALTPIVTAVGAAFLTIFSGSVIAETILSIDGIGRWFFQSTLMRDLPVIQFLAIYTAFLVVIVNLIVDLSYAWIDPRVQYR